MNTYLLNNSTRIVVSMILVMAVFFTACSESELSSLGENSVETTAPAKLKKGGVPANLIPNAQRYANNSMPSASGRDGEVIVTTRALIDSEGNVDMEVTTGTLDGDNQAPGTLTKVQVKALDLDTPEVDEPTWTKNYNKLNNGSYFSTSYEGLTRGQQLYVHANVKGIIRGTAVVFMNEYIKNRPDLQVTGVSAVEEAFLNEEVVITATIAETNADLGASTSCVLYIDGEEVDRANNVWVDAGDAVGCIFTTSFAEVGEKNIVVAAEDVTPGDFDSSNNSAFTSVNVIEEPSGEFGTNSWNWSGGVFMSNKSRYETRNGPTYNVNEYESYLIYFSGNIPNPTNFQIPTNVVGLIESGEYSFDFDVSLPTTTGTCSYVYDNELRLQVGVCDYGYQANFNINFNTYKSLYYGYDMYQGDFYTYNQYGPDFGIADEINFAFLIGSSTASGVIPVTANSYEYENYYGPENYSLSQNTSYYGWGSGTAEYQEVGAESADVEGEEDVEE